MAHSSFFQYPITKPYPFRWFTPLVFGGGTLLIALFTFVTIATNGYQLQNHITLDPNATLNHRPWHARPPFTWRNSVQTACSPVNIVTGASFITHNLGFTYNLYSISKIDPQTKALIPTASVGYTNQILENCTLLDMWFDYRKRGGSETVNGAWWLWTDSTVSARANCTVSTAEGDFLLAFSTQVSPQSPWGFSYVVKVDIETSTSIWWGTRLINSSWRAILMSFVLLGPEPNPQLNPGKLLWSSGSMQLFPGPTDDIKSDTFLDGSFHFTRSNVTVYGASVVEQGLYNNKNNYLSMVATQGINFAKFFYSTILVDLGQSSPPNPLLNPSLLGWALETPEDVFRNDPGSPLNCTTDSCAYNGYRAAIASISNTDDDLSKEYIPLNTSFTQYTPGTPGYGALGTNKTTILTQYTCSIPTLKDGGSLFVTVTIALLVSLTASWTLLNLVAKSIVERQDPVQARSCGTCTCTRMHKTSSSGVVVDYNDGYGNSYYGYTDTDVDANADAASSMSMLKMMPRAKKGPFQAISTVDEWENADHTPPPAVQPRGHF